MSENAVITLNHLEKAFGDNSVLKDINLTVKRGEVISVIGSSGSGKSTLLHVCAGLDTGKDKEKSRVSVKEKLRVSSVEGLGRVRNEASGYSPE